MYQFSNIMTYLHYFLGFHFKIKLKFLKQIIERANTTWKLLKVAFERN